MIEIDGKIISRVIFEKKFVCDLNACKGACCIEGDVGAPLEHEETQILEEIYEDVKPFMTPEGITAIDQQGTHVIDEIDNEPVTPLINGNECAYVNRDDNGITFCSIEKAYLAKKINFKKPISCHLYPIRINKYQNFDAINYHEWDICAPACDCGSKLDIPIYRFLKEPISRKYGQEFYSQLVEIKNELTKNNSKA